MQSTIGNRKRIGSFLILSLFFSLIAALPDAFGAKGDSAVELRAGYGFGPNDSDFEFGTTFSPGIGFGTEIQDNLQLRVDASYFRWKDNEDLICEVPFPCTPQSAKLQNIPLFVGGRFLADLTPAIRLFAELGLSVNFLKAEVSALGETFTERDTKLGIVPGLGIEFKFPTFGFGVDLRYYFTTKGVGDADDLGTSFLNAVAFLAFYF